MRPVTRRGSVFLIAMAAVTVMVVLAYGLLAVARNGYTGARAANLRALSQLAARLGTAHADAVINRAFLVPGKVDATMNPSGRAVPATLGGAWRQSFLPIDTYRTGKTTSTLTDDHPVGQDNSPENLNDNDSRTENLLTELYCAVGTSGHAGYVGRGSMFRGGSLNHPGCGRYIEPGYYNSDLIGKPVSFHLERDATNTLLPSSDPERAREVGSTIDVPVSVPSGDQDRPLWLDGDLREVPTRADARYRLRYAVAVEDLSGHLMMTPQGPWSLPDAQKYGLLGNTTGTVVASVSLTDDQARQTSETDIATADHNADAFANLAWCTINRGGYASHYYGQSPWGAWLTMKGWGSVARDYDTDNGNPTSSRYYLLRRYNDDPAKPWPQRAIVGAERRPDATDWAAATHDYANRGPAMSFEQAGNPNLAPGGQMKTVCMNTPFGKAGRVVAAPAAWDDAYTDTIWRVNLPTASPAALRAMLYAYLPSEFLTLNVRRSRQRVTAVSPSPQGKYTSYVNDPAVWVDHPLEHIDLFSPTGANQKFFSYLAPMPYPGTDPKDADPAHAWSTTLGTDIDENLLTGLPSAINAHARNVPSVIWGQDTSYLEFIAYYHKSLLNDKATDYEVGDTADTLVMADKYESTKILDNSFWYPHSYWLDLCAAFAHSMAATQYAWMGEDGSGYDGAPYPVGRTVWPTPWDPDATYPDGMSLAGKPTLDLDLDGDGNPDAPSYLGTVEQVDRQFLRNLGEWPQNQDEHIVLGSRSTIPSMGLVSFRDDSVNQYQPAKLLPHQCTNNIKSLLSSGKISPAQAGLMEMVLNDMRMSFFGSSPQYPHFAPLDFDDDGTVRSSCYTAATGAAGQRPAIDGRGPEPGVGERFSLTGCFVMQKSRYYRIFVRGEVYDCLRQMPVACSDLETVYHLDPEGRIFDLYDRRLPGALPPLRAETLFQRWMRNRYPGSTARGQ